MKKVLGLAILASLIATPVLAGETFVRNEWTKTNSHTDTDLYLDSKTTSERKENYDSSAYKYYYSVDSNEGADYSIDGKTKDFTYHTASSGLWGSFKENNDTHVYGTIVTKTDSYSKAHETSSGVR